MATEVGDTLAPLDTSGSGVYGADTASELYDYDAASVVHSPSSTSIRGDNASKSTYTTKPMRERPFYPVTPFHITDEEILRVCIKGFEYDGRKSDLKGEVVISQAGRRKVALRLPQAWKKNLLLIDLDRVILVPCAQIDLLNLRCMLHEQQNAKPNLFSFETTQDMFKFQEVFTGFSVEMNIRRVSVNWKPKGQAPKWTLSDVQLWKKVPDRTESLSPAHYGLPAPSQLLENGAKRDLLDDSRYPTQIHTTTASNEALVQYNDLVRKRHASSLLVISGHGLRVPWFVGAPLIRLPIYGRISTAELGRSSRGIRLVEDGATAGYRSRSKPFASISQRSSAMTKRAAGLKALGLGESASNAWRSSEFGDSIIQDFATTSGAAELIALGLKESDVKASRLSEIDHFNIQELDWVELEFKNMEGKMDFRAAFNALKDWHGSLVEAETHSPERRAFVEPVSLTRKINWDEGKVSKEKDVVPPAKQTSAKPALTSLHGAKAGQVNYSAPRSQTQRSLAGDPTNFPEMVAIAQSVAASPDSKFRPQPGLVGNPIIHPVRTGDMLPPVTAPLDSKTRRQQGLVGDSTYHPDEKAGRLLLVAGSSNFDSKSHGRSRSYDVLDADQQTSSKTSYESSVGEMKRLRSTRIAHTGGQGRTPRIHSPSYAAHIANRKSKRVSWLLDEPLEAFAKAKQIQRQRRICRKLVLSVLWKWELNDGVPKEMWSSPASFEFINVLEVSRFDKIKNLFEAYSGREWDWWPLDPPAKPLESGNVRIRWQCTCGDQRWTDISKYLAQKCQAFVNENTAAGHESGNAASQSASSTANHPQLRSVVPGSFPSDTSQSTGVTSNICSTAQAAHIQETNKSSHSKELYVLLCIYQGSQILHSQILASKCQNDEAFFENLRKEYRRLRGLFRFWFSPLQFSHCDFVKFTRFYVNELAKVGHSLPIDLVYQYNPRPPGPHEDPPISPHEFRRRFYTHFANPCGRDEALERIPKRQKRFQINLHVDGREDMWGLHVELRPSFLIVLMWQIVITAGGWAFMGWWLSRHKGDLQNAAVPVTLIVTAVMALWAPIRKGITEAL